MYGTPENTSAIPANSISDGIPYYTIDVDELVEETQLVERSTEWVNYEWNVSGTEIEISSHVRNDVSSQGWKMKKMELQIL